MPSRQAARKSYGPRPSGLGEVDKSAPVDDQLAVLKNVFVKSSGYLAGGSQSPDSQNIPAQSRPVSLVASNGDGKSGGALTEISVQASINGPRNSDVD